MKRSSYIFFLLLACGLVPSSSTTIFEEPDVWDADEILSKGDAVELVLDWLEVQPFPGGPSFETRALGGSFPGPTITISAGVTLNIKFRNNLKRQNSAKRASDAAVYRNQFQDPDVGNLHFHGAHVTSVLPGDDTTMAVEPGDSYDYLLPFMDRHMPGIHWIHSHHHGSTSLHLGGGAAMALIVKDPPGFLPQQIADAEEAVMVLQDIDVREQLYTASRAGDDKYAANLQKLLDVGIPGADESNYRFVTVNGQHQPTLNTKTGTWTRWRILYAGWQDLSLEFEKVLDEAQCEFQLLAKDGIYLTDYPRPVDMLPIAPGGRADVMVRCNSAGVTKIHALGRMTLTVVAESEDNLSSSSDEDLVPWTPDVRPDYLVDLMSAEVSPGCSCSTKLEGYDDGSLINRKVYIPGNHFLHTSYLGATVERKLSFGYLSHSYHQHVYPFQVVSSESKEISDYFKVGDWHDTYMYGIADLTIRYRPTVLPGKIMVHCHNSLHADRGMMAKEYVRDIRDGQCQCEVDGSISGVGIVDDLDKGGHYNGSANLKCLSTVAICLIVTSLALLL